MAEYEEMVPGIFLNRPNRFIAYVKIAGEEKICHVKNTGRCRELLVPGTTVWCQHHPSSANRKTEYSLIAVKKGERLINMDSQIPNQVALEWLQAGGLGAVPQIIRREVKFDNSRFDLYFEMAGKKAFMEVKGVTLEEDNLAKFPDAPTARGNKHLLELQKAVRQGYEGYILFVIQMADVLQFSPNWQTDPAFSRQLCQAAQAGVQILARECHVTPTSIQLSDPVPIQLEPISNVI